MKRRLQSWIRTMQKYAGRWWYAPFISALAFLDLFLIVIPTDGLLVSAVMLAPRRWIYTAFWVALGSSLGCVLLAHLLQAHGLPFLLQIAPGIDQSAAWKWTDGIMHQWGTWALFGIAVSPLMQHPAVAIAAFAGLGAAQVGLVVFAGRILKYLFLSWLASHAPGFVGRLWGMQHELEDVGLADKTQNPPP